MPPGGCLSECDHRTFATVNLQRRSAEYLEDLALNHTVLIDVREISVIIGGEIGSPCSKLVSALVRSAATRQQQHKTNDKNADIDAPSDQQQQPADAHHRERHQYPSDHRKIKPEVEH